MNKKVDVFVVGGGPAGLAAAIAVRQQGFSVAVADGADHPIDKPCGEGLIPETQGVLAKLNIRIPEQVGFRFRGIRFLQTEEQVCADYSCGQGIGIRRTDLHDVLVTAAENCGVELFWKTPVVGLDNQSAKLKHFTVEARWILGADGVGSRVRRWAGLEGAEHRRQRFATRRHYRVKPWTDYMEIYWGEHAQAYVTPISNQEICIVILSQSEHDANFGESMRNWPQLQERFGHAELGSRERGAITSMHSLRSVYRGNVALVGDASGSVDAITGDGLRLAFCQAFALAGAMKRGDLREYQRVHRQLARRPTVMGNLMLMLGRHARLRRRTVRSLAAKPELFKQLISNGGDWSAPMILATGARLGWQILAS